MAAYQSGFKYISNTVDWTHSKQWNYSICEAPKSEC